VAENILTRSKSAYLYLSLVVIVLCYAVYRSQSGIEGTNGGTAQGYALGIIGAALIVWLTCLGVRKRRFNSRMGSVKGWVSAHVYLGTSLFFVATFHSAFQFGINVHTLAYSLMIIVIASGFYGVYAYLRYPQMVSALSNGKSRDANFQVLEEMEKEVEGICERCDSDLQMIVSSAIDRTTIGGSNLDQLLSRDHSTMFENIYGENEITRVDIVANTNQQTVIDYVAKRVPRGKRVHETELLIKLLDVLTRRQQLLRDLRQSLHLQVRIKIWLLFHIPVTVALLVSLTIHIVSVFFYW